MQGDKQQSTTPALPAPSIRLSELCIRDSTRESSTASLRFIMMSTNHVLGTGIAAEKMKTICVVLCCLLGVASALPVIMTPDSVPKPGCSGCQQLVKSMQVIAPPRILFHRSP